MNTQWKHFARLLRQRQTPQEQKLWKELRGRRFFGHKFRRQFPIEGVIADFCCWERKLVIEIDGGGHTTEVQLQADRLRDEKLDQLGFSTMRFWNSQIDRELEQVLEQIKNYLK